MKPAIISFISILLVSIPLLAQEPALDPTFHYLDRGSSAGFNGKINVLVPLDDGNHLVGGDFLTYRYNPAPGLVRLLNDGEIDPSFEMGTGFQNPGGGSFSVNSIQVQPDKKLIVGGEFTFYKDSGVNRIIRLNPDGSRDPSFQVGTGFNRQIGKVRLQPDGKILVGEGTFTTYNGEFVPPIMRINPDGSWDTSFNPEGVSRSDMKLFEIQADGKILVHISNGLIRLNPDGSKDDTFQLAEPFGQTVYDPFYEVDIFHRFTVTGIIPEENGNILLCGEMFPLLKGKNLFMRLLPDGSLDRSFQTIIVEAEADEAVPAIAKGPDGKIYKIHSYGAYEIVRYLNRILSDGRQDASFKLDVNSEEIFVNGQILEVQNDGKVLASGGGVGRSGLFRFNTDGSMDQRYNPKPEFNLEVYAMTLEKNGKILAGGKFKSYADKTVHGLARINPDGLLDETFDVGSGLDLSGSRLSILAQADGRILLAGDLRSYDGNAVKRIIRLNQDGGFDETFQLEPGLQIGVLSQLHQQTDGKLIVPVRNSINFETFQSLIRLNPDGSKDDSFDLGTNISDSSPWSIVSAPGEKILVGGNFSSFKGQRVNKLVRLNSDGSFDPSFEFSEMLDIPIKNLFVQADGKILVVGLDWRTNMGLRLMRLNPNGSLDSGFMAGVSPTSLINSILILPDNNILLGIGEFSSHLVRLLPDGRIDPSFNPNFEFDGPLSTLLLDTEGSLYAAGNFTSFNEVTANNVVKIPNFISLPTLPSEVIRINAGGPTVRFGSEEWRADTYFTGGKVYSNTVPIADTENDALYQTERNGNISYEIPVPEPGFYTLELHFAEIHWEKAGVRLFDVLVEGGLIKENIDLVKDTGVKTAHIIRLENLEVKDGNLSLELRGRKDRAKISGLALFTQDQTEIPETVRINAGGGALQFGEEVWQADGFYSGGRTYSTTASILNTNKAPLYQSERFGNFTYEIPLMIKGTYIVELHFAEIHWNRANARLFRFRLENGSPTGIIDLYKDHGGANNAYVVQISDVLVMDGALNLEFITEKDWAKLSGVAVYKQSLSYHTPGEERLRINVGGPRLTQYGEIWSSDVYYNGGLSFNVGPVEISNTYRDEVYQSERFGNFSYQLPAPEAGLYAVDLHFAEIHWNNSGARVFGLEIENGQFVAENIDLFKDHGGKNSAYIIRAENINVSDGNLDIKFTSQKDNAKLSGIILYKQDGTIPNARLAQESLVWVQQNTRNEDEKETHTTINLYPNPARDRINLEFDTDQSGFWNVVLINSLGVAIHSERQNLEKGRHHLEIDLSAYRLSAGAYYLQLTSERQAPRILRVIIQ